MTKNTLDPENLTKDEKALKQRISTVLPEIWAQDTDMEYKDAQEAGALFGYFYSTSFLAAFPLAEIEKRVKVLEEKYID